MRSSDYHAKDSIECAYARHQARGVYINLGEVTHFA